MRRLVWERIARPTPLARRVLEYEVIRAREGEEQRARPTAAPSRKVQRDAVATPLPGPGLVGRGPPLLHSALGPRRRAGRAPAGPRRRRPDRRHPRRPEGRRPGGRHSWPGPEPGPVRGPESVP